MAANVYSIETLKKLGFDLSNPIAWEEVKYLKVKPIRRVFNIKTQEWEYRQQDVYDYWGDIELAVMNHDILPVKEINQCGSRLSGKTYHTVRAMIKLIMISIKYDLKIAIYGFRKFGANVQEFKKEFDNALRQYHIPQSSNKAGWTEGSFYRYKNTNNSPFYEFINGSFIQLKGLNKSNKEEASLKGLASALDFDYAFKVEEEANEISKHQSEDANFAVRGAHQFLTVRMANPDSPYQDYIAYCMNRMPFDEQTMLTKGQQFGIYTENRQKKIFHYTNYQVNPYLSLDEVNHLLELSKLDPYRYKAWGIGIPATPDEAIFSRYLDMKPKTQFLEPIELQAGVDLGHADGGHPTAAILLGIDKNNIMKPIKELYHANDEMNHWDNEELAKQIIEFFTRDYHDYLTYVKKSRDIDLIFDYDEEKLESLEARARLYAQGLDVKVDYGDGGDFMIDILNRVLLEQYPEIDWLNFSPVDKNVWFIKDRIDATISLITTGTLIIDKETTPNLVREMNLMKYKLALTERSSHKLEIIDLHDDPFDALCYSFMDRLKDELGTIAKANPMLVGKGQRKYETL